MHCNVWEFRGIDMESRLTRGREGEREDQKGRESKAQQDNNIQAANGFCRRNRGLKYDQSSFFDLLRVDAINLNLNKTRYTTGTVVLCPETKLRKVQNLYFFGLIKD